MEKTICRQCTIMSNVAQKLNEKEICELQNNCAEVHFKAGDIIVKQDALSTNVVYIKSGLVKIHIKGPTRERIRRISMAPAYLCLPSSLGDKVNHFSATAIEDTTVCFIDVNIFRKFIYENGDFAYQIILEMSKSELQNIKNCLNNTQKQNSGKIADAILFFAGEIYHSNEFTLPVSRQDIAEMTGITRESVCRILTDFNKEQIIEMDSKKIRIVNEKLLRQISEKG